MSYYKERLNPWVVVRCLPDRQRVTIARFRNSAEAEGRLRILQQTRPHDRFAVAFEPPNPEGVPQPTL